jgi:hypothetical protein
MKVTNIQYTTVAAASLLLLAGTLTSSVAACYTANAVKCATMNESTCVAKGCNGHAETATASADAYTYPAISTSDNGVDQTKGQPGCIFPAN